MSEVKAGDILKYEHEYYLVVPNEKHFIDLFIRAWKAKPKENYTLFINLEWLCNMRDYIIPIYNRDEFSEYENLGCNFLLTTLYGLKR